MRIDENVDSGQNRVIRTGFDNKAAVMQSTSDEMTAAPRSCPCSSQRHQSGSQQTARMEKYSVEEPLFSKWAIYCFQGYRTSWSVSESGLARPATRGSLRDCS